MARTHKYLEGTKARDAYFKGADTVAKIVIDSIGPYGLNLAMEKGKKTTNDGKIISQEVSVAIPDEFERQGALLQHQYADKTNDKVADATSTTIALNYGIRKKLVKDYLKTDTRFVAKKSVDQLKKDLDKEKEFVIAEMQKMVKPLETKEDLVNSAMVSVENEQLAKLIGETQWELGQEGRLIPEEVNEDVCSVEPIKGILIDNGFASSLMINDPKEQALIVNNGNILLTNYQIHEKEVREITKLITQMFANQMNDLVIIAQAFSNEAVQAFLGMEQQFGFRCYVINAPYVNQAQLLLDIESVTGGKAVLKDKDTLEDLSLINLGKFSKLKMRISGGIISGLPENDHLRDARVNKLKEELEGEESTFAKRQLEERIAALNGKLAFLKIGSTILDDRKRLKDKADDAVVSVRMAWKGGTIPGAGLAFKEIADKMPQDSILKEPLQIIYNQIKMSAPEGFVVEDWVRDPFITLSTALTNACDGAISMSRINGATVQRDVKPQDKSYEDE